MAAAGGQVYLLSNSTPITTTGDQAGAAGVVDMVGPRASTSFETAATSGRGDDDRARSTARPPVPTPTTTPTDFSLAAPTPQAAGPGTPPPPPTEYTIAEIQGTDTDTSPHVGETVITQGVVTADYATGGFNGFYLQTAGTGGPTDATPGASDAIFVFGSAAAAKVHLGDFVHGAGQGERVRRYDGDRRHRRQRHRAARRPRPRHPGGDRLPDDRRRARGPRGRAPGADERVHGDRQLRHQLVRRGRPGDR